MRKSYQSHADWTKRSSPGKNPGAKNSPVRHSKAWLRKRKRRRRMILLIWSALLCAALIVLVVSASLFLNKTEIGADPSGEEGGDALETVTEGISTAEEVEITIGDDSLDGDVEEAEETITHDTPDISNLSWPFTTMSLDWMNPSWKAGGITTSLLPTQRRAAIFQMRCRCISMRSVRIMRLIIRL